MSRRVEVRARLKGSEDLAAQLESMAGQSAESEERETFFETPDGQLKLVRSDSGSRLVYREAAGGDLASEAELMKSSVSEPAELEAILSTALGVREALLVRRRVYRIGEVQASLDRIDGLGDFIELQVEVKPPETAAGAWNAAVDLAEKLGLDPSQLISAPYVELLGDSV